MRRLLRLSQCYNDLTREEIIRRRENLHHLDSIPGRVQHSTQSHLPSAAFDLSHVCLYKKWCQYESICASHSITHVNIHLYYTTTMPLVMTFNFQVSYRLNMTSILPISRFLDMIQHFCVSTYLFPATPTVSMMSASLGHSRYSFACAKSLVDVSLARCPSAFYLSRQSQAQPCHSQTAPTCRRSEKRYATSSDCTGCCSWGKDLWSNYIITWYSGTASRKILPKEGWRDKLNPWLC